MERPTIAIDLDDTLIPFIEPFIRWLNETYDDAVKYELEKITSYRIRDVYTEPSIDWDARLDQFVESQFQHTMSPFDESKNILQQLAENSRLIIVTARPEMHRTYTEQWLDKEFPGLFDGLYMRTHYSATHNKGEVCNYLGAKVLVDDAVHNIDAANRHGVEGILYGDYPMQRDFLSDQHRRALNWAEVGKILLSSHD